MADEGVLVQRLAADGTADPTDRKVTEEWEPSILIGKNPVALLTFQRCTTHSASPEYGFRVQTRRLNR